MSALAASQPVGGQAAGEWAQIAARAPRMADTLGRYLTQVGTVLAPNSVLAADLALRQFARWLLEHTDVQAVADIGRGHVEDYKVWLAAQPGIHGDGLSATTQRQRLHMLRMFFERVIEWDWADAPARNPIIGRDIPPRREALPRFLDDRDAARLMAAARAATDPRDRLVVEVLARTGMRAGELCDLDADAVVLIGDGHWLRIPVGKLRNDRYVPLHPDLVTLLAEWTAAQPRPHPPPPPTASPTTAAPSTVTSSDASCAASPAMPACVVHPHQLRHTLATQAINRGMRLEAIAALLGHRSMHMTLTYARIADRVVADEYAAVSAQIDALYGQHLAVAETGAMTRLRREAHARMLGNGLCTRPVELDCRMESACETCAYFPTGVEFRPVLLRQRDHARDHHQPDRAALFDGLLNRLEEPS